MFILEDII